MDLRERLRMLKAANAARHGVTGAAVRPAAQPQGAQPEGAPVRADGPARIGGLDGYQVASGAGHAFFVQTEYPVEYCRGPLPLEHVYTLPPGAWELLGRVQGFDARRAVYLDTETTGLGGMGTYLFLVGLGFFDGHNFVVRQYFMRDYPDEPAHLEAIQRELSRFDALVTFNGRSFDWPLLEGRFLLHRMRPPLGGAPHLDLLHPSRRIWKERLRSCTLTNLEAEVLGLRRHGDIPGELIPSLYFQYLRSGEIEPLIPVFLHNRMDIVSLVSLAGWLGHMAAAPLEQTPDGELVCGDDLVALARLLQARGHAAEALLCLEAALQRGLGAVSEAKALGALSQSYKRVRDHERAVAVWERMIELEPNLAAFPLIELAKYYEHAARDYGRALGYAQQALEVALRRRSLVGAYGPAAAREVADARRRLERLERKRSHA
jgi:uncharacterized protein